MLRVKSASYRQSPSNLDSRADDDTVPSYRGLPTPTTAIRISCASSYHCTPRLARHPPSATPSRNLPAHSHHHLLFHPSVTTFASRRTIVGPSSTVRKSPKLRMWHAPSHQPSLLPSTGSHHPGYPSRSSPSRADGLPATPRSHPPSHPARPASRSDSPSSPTSRPRPS